MEVLEERQEFILVSPQDGLDLWRFLWVCDKHLHQPIHSTNSYIHIVSEPFDLNSEGGKSVI